MVVGDSAERDAAAIHKDTETTSGSKEVSQDKVVVAKDKLSQLSLLPGWRSVEESTKGLELYHQEHDIRLYVDSTPFSGLGDDVTFHSYKKINLKLLDGPDFSLMQEDSKSMKVGSRRAFQVRANSRVKSQDTTIVTMIDGAQAIHVISAETKRFDVEEKRGLIDAVIQTFVEPGTTPIAADPAMDQVALKFVGVWSHPVPMTKLAELLTISFEHGIWRIQFDASDDGKIESFGEGERIQFTGNTLKWVLASDSDFVGASKYSAELKGEFLHCSWTDRAKIFPRTDVFTRVDMTPSKDGATERP